MIFKTFDSDIDKWSAKIGILGKSFNKLNTAKSKALETSTGIFDIEFWKGFKKNLSKNFARNSLGEIVSSENIDSYIAELDLDGAKKELEKIFNWDKTGKPWDEYFKKLGEGKDYIKDLIKSTGDLSKLEGQDLVDACNKARKTVIAQNQELANTSLKAKASQAALKGLSMAGNMLAGIGIAFATEAIFNGLDYLINYEEKQKEVVEHAKATTQEAADSIKNLKEETSDTSARASELSTEYANLVQGVDPFTNENKRLSTDDYERFLDINNQLAELFPSLTKTYDENGNAILGLSGDVDTVTDSIKKLVEWKETLTKGEMFKHLEDYVNGTDESEGIFTVLESESEDISSKQEEIDKLKEVYDNMLNGRYRTTPELFANRDIIEGKLGLTIGDGHTEYGKASLILGDSRLGFSDDTIKKITKERKLDEDSRKKIIQAFSLNPDLTTDEVINAYQLAHDEAERLKEKMSESYTISLRDLQSQLSVEESELNSKNKEMSDQMMIWVSDLDFYKNSDNEYFKRAIGQMVDSIKWSDLDIEDLDGAKQFLQDQIITPLNLACSDPDKKLEIMSALSGLFQTDFSEMSFSDAKTLIDSYLTPLMNVINEKLSEDEKLNLSDMYKKLGFEEYNESADKIKDSIKSISGDNSAEYDKLVQYTNDFNQGQLQAWLSATDGAKSADEAIQKYEQSIAATKKSVKKSSFADVWDSLGTDGTDEQRKTAQETKEDLLELAEAGKLTVKAFEKSSIAKDIMEQTGLSAKELTKKINHLKSSIEQLSSMKSGISSISAILAKKKDNMSDKKTKTVGIDADTLAGMPEDVKANTAQYERFIKILGNGHSIMKTCKSAANDLATAYVNSNNFLANLTESNKKYYISQLDEMGIQNSRKVVQDALNMSKVDEILLNWDVVTATNADIASKANEINLLDGATNAVKLYTLQKAIANKNSLSTSKSVSNLIALARQCGITGDALNELEILQNMMSERTKIASDTKMNSQERDARIANLTAKITAQQLKVEKAAKKKAKVKIRDTDFKPDTSTSTPKSNTSSNTKQKTTTRQEIDWISRALDRLSSKLDLVKSKYDNLVDKKGVKTDDALLRARIKNLNDQYRILKKTAKYQQRAADKYSDKADNVKLSKSLKNAVRNGRITGSRSKLIATYGEATAEKIQKYQDYYDKSQEKKKARQETLASMRENKQARYQNRTDLYNTRVSRAEAKEAISVGSKDKNVSVNTQIDNLKKSYDYQIKIAKLNGQSAEAKRLEYELQKKINDLVVHRIENIQKDYENQISLIDNQAQDVKNKVSLLEARGKIITAGYYSSQLDYENGKRAKAVQERNSIQHELNSGIKKGKIKVYSDEWYDIQSRLQTLDNTISECDVSIAENTTAIREVHTALLDAKEENANRIRTEASFITELLSRRDMTDSDTGAFTKEGIAALGASGINLETAQSQLRELNKERAILESMKASGKLDYGDNGIHKYDSSEQLDAAYKSIIDKQQEWAKNEFDAEQKIIDLVKEYYQVQLDYMKEIIDAKKEALDYEKDLYDYQQNIADKTKSIATLEKQLASLQGDDSEEGRARRAQLQLSLDEANQDLQDTEYDKYISDQQKMLDNLYSEYEDLMSNLFKDTDTLLQDGIAAINNNALLIQDILNKTAGDYNYDYSRNFADILDAFGSNTQIVTGIQESIYGDDSSIAGKLDIQNKYLETKYGEAAAGSGSDGGNSNSGGDSGSGSFTITKADGSSAPGQHDSGWVPSTSTQNAQAKKNVENFIKSNKQKAKKKRNKYSDVNKIIYDMKFDKKNHYVLSTANLKNLAHIIGIANYDGASKKGRLYTKLHDLGVSGFQMGGIIRTSGVPKNGDHVLVRANPDETILTQRFTDMLPEAVDIMESFIRPQLISDHRLLPKGNFREPSFGDVVIHAELPDVKNPLDFVNALQSDTRVRRAFAIATKDLISKGRITNNIQSIH